MPLGRKKTIGAWGEEQACAFLCRQNFVIVERNYYTTVGEIDIVARRGDDIYFIEVKTRTSPEMANDWAITRRKKYRFEKTVRRYCYDRRLTYGSFMSAGLIVLVNRLTKQVHFRLVVMR